MIHPIRPFVKATQPLSAAGYPGTVMPKLEKLETETMTERETKSKSERERERDNEVRKGEE